MRYLKKYNILEQRNSDLSLEELSKKSVTIIGKYIEYGIGNGSHKINLGDGLNTEFGYDDEEENSGSSSYDSKN